jgi:hypothetical protein
MKAWVVYWESSSNRIIEDPVAAILYPRLSEKIVGQIVEYIYGIHAYTLAECAFYAKRPSARPYKTEWHQGLGVCGHSPYLTAVHAEDVEVREDPVTGLETVLWVQPPRYRRDTRTKEREMVTKPIKMSLTRRRTGALSFQEIEV